MEYKHYNIIMHSNTQDFFGEMVVELRDIHNK